MIFFFFLNLTKTESPDRAGNWRAPLVNEIYNFSTPNRYVISGAATDLWIKGGHVCQGARLALQFYWINTSHFRSNRGPGQGGGCLALAAEPLDLYSIPLSDYPTLSHTSRIDTL